MGLLRVSELSCAIQLARWPLSMQPVCHMFANSTDNSTQHNRGIQPAEAGSSLSSSASSPTTSSSSVTELVPFKLVNDAVCGEGGGVWRGHI